MKVREIISENEINEGVLSTIFGKPVGAVASGVKKILTKSPKELKFKQDVATIKAGMQIISAKASEVLTLLKNFGLAYPFITYYKNMSAAQDNLKSGKWDQNRYDEEKRIQIGLVAATLVTGLAGNRLIKLFESFFKIVKIIPGVGEPAAALISGLSETAQVTLMYYLNTTEGRTLIANLFTVGIIEGAGDIIGNQLSNLKALVTKAVEHDKSDVIPGSTTSNKPSSDQVKQQPTTEPEKQTKPSTPLEPSNKDAGEYVDSRFVRDPNGELRLAVDKD